MATNPALLQSLWDRALVEEIGIRFTVDGKSKMSFINELYTWRKTNGAAIYATLMIFQPNDGKIYIVKRATELRE